MTWIHNSSLLKVLHVQTILQATKKYNVLYKDYKLSLPKLGKNDGKYYRKTFFCHKFLKLTKKTKVSKNHTTVKINPRLFT